MNKIIIAIDGFSGCGKSTLARQLAEKLQYVYIDTGAMYRAITLYFIENKISPADENGVEEALKTIDLRFQKNTLSGKNEIMLNGKNVEEKIRSMAVAGKVSEVAALPSVRQFGVDAQRRMGEDKGVVMDGRDIGTVVFPHAELKIFVTADPEIRVERRFRELLKTNPDVRRDDIRKNLEQRDYTDLHRKVGPLRQADDAILLDNSHLTREEQLQEALKLVKMKQ